MKNRYSLLLSLLIFNFVLARSGDVYVASYVNQNIDVPSGTNLHITAGENALLKSNINLMAEDAWLYFDNMRPAVVLNAYKNNVFINGSALAPESNAEVRVYAHGTVIVPHAPEFQPLEVFTEKDYGGSSMKYGTYIFYKDLGEFDNNIRSFKLKKGYMATFANKQDGTGYSRVFIADKQDLEVSAMPDLLDGSISFIRVFRWDWTTKKGWCGGNPAFADTLNCTWYYSWSADKESTPNYQYVPIKQQLYWPGFNEINSKKDVCHLLGYNEPDHTDQANMTYEQAVSQWPEMLATGLRLGAPVPSNPGNGDGWLYKFLAKCDSLNYRVDYVVVHAYWGGKTPQSWYSTLKQEYEKCGKRPLWITEWNNGANWTNEWWPNDADAQKQKQLTDLKGILNVLDTCSFVERYSIYDWVNEVRINSNNDTKMVIRAMIWDNKLTPAGEYYKNNKSQLAYNANKEYIPTWRIAKPKLNYSVSGNTVSLSVDDPNEGIVSWYIIEQKINSGEYTEVAQIPASQKSYVNNLADGSVGDISYRVRLVLKNGDKSTVSNIAKYNISSGKGRFQYGKSYLDNTDWAYFKYHEDYGNSPVVVFGTPSYSVNTPMSTRVKSINQSTFQFHLDTWAYLGNPGFDSNVEISYLCLPVGEYDLNGVKAQAGSVKNVGKAWVKVTFSVPFEVIPGIFVTQTTSRNSYALSARVRNVSTTGFEVCLQKELALQDLYPTTALENVNYVAVTPGTGTIDGRKLIVGLTEENTVGSIYSPAVVSFGENIENPLFFGFMQTTSDTIVSTLRYSNLTSGNVKMFRQRELSKSGSPSAGSKELAAWMVIDMENDVSVIEAQNAEKQEYTLFPNPVRDILSIGNNRSSRILQVEIFSVSGQKILQDHVVDNLNVSKLRSGIYYLRIDNRHVYKILKQ